MRTEASFSTVSSPLDFLSRRARAQRCPGIKPTQNVRTDEFLLLPEHPPEGPSQKALFALVVISEKLPPTTKINHFLLDGDPLQVFDDGNRSV